MGLVLVGGDLVPDVAHRAGEAREVEELAVVEDVVVVGDEVDEELRAASLFFANFQIV